MTVDADIWFLTRPFPAPPRLRLVCFPYAGGTSAVFHEWWLHVPPDLSVSAVQLPGRGRRLAEIAYTDLPPLVDAVSDAMASYLARPYALFGHSNGALLAFELARSLIRRRLPPPVHVVVSGCAAPHLVPGHPPVHALPDRDLVEHLRTLEGTPPEILDNAEAMRLLLPTIRADLALGERYQYVAGPPLPCPITALAGADDLQVRRLEVAAWCAYTSRTFRLRIHPGGHFALQTATEPFVRAVVQEIEGGAPALAP